MYWPRGHIRPERGNSCLAEQRIALEGKVQGYDRRDPGWGVQGDSGERENLS